MKKKSIKKVIFLAVIIIILVLSFYYLDTKYRSEEEDLTDYNFKAVASIFPVYDIMRQIGQNEISTVLLLPPGASPHTFSPTPSQVKELQGSDVLAYIGLGIDDFALSLVNLENKSDFVSLDLSKNIALMPSVASHEEDEEDEHDSLGFDPHYWLSPDNAIVITSDIAQTFSELDPENADLYQQRAQDYINKLRQEDERWKQAFMETEDNKVLVFHDAWNYFAKHFNLDIVASFEPYPGKSPTPKYLQSVQNVLQENNISTIYIEPQLAPELAQSMANNLEVEIMQLDPIGGIEERDTYIKLIDYNVKAILSGFNQ